MLRRFFGCKAKNATGCNRKLHNKSLYSVYASQCVIKTIISNGTVKGGMWCTHTHTQTQRDMKIMYIILARKIYDERYRSRYKRCINLNTLRTGDADLRFYITTVQDG
jgi:hypothetical protein